WRYDQWQRQSAGELFGKHIGWGDVECQHDGERSLQSDREEWDGAQQHVDADWLLFVGELFRQYGFSGYAEPNRHRATVHQLCDRYSYRSRDQQQYAGDTDGRFRHYDPRPGYVGEVLYR